MPRGKHRRTRGLSSAVVTVAVALVLVVSVSAWAVIRGSEPDLDTASRTPPPTSATPSPQVEATPSASPTPERGKLVIHGTGDVNLDTGYIPNLDTHGYGYAWSGLDGLFKKDDLTVVNLECAVTTKGDPVAKDFTFRANPRALGSMRSAGVEVANLGNNHSRDYGAEALLDSRANLLRHDIQPVGVGRDADQAHEPAIFEIQGWTVAVLGFGGVVPTPDWIAGPDHPGMADGDDIPSMVAAVEAADQVADIVIVAIHWGVELDTEPRQEDVDRAFALIDAGADAIFGHHPHRLQPMGRYRGRPIFWSLGNFVWPTLSVEGSTTAVAEVTISPKGKVTGRLLPAYIVESGHPVLTSS